jgi:ATP-dependent RNA helicase DeaD
MNFENFNLNPLMLNNITKMGYETASEIQEKAIPVILEGKDIIGLAQTGTGKTAAFGLPAISTLVPNKKVQLLVIAPTRELVQQVAKNFESFSVGMNLTTLVIYGGSSYERQISSLRRGVEIICATPGRLIDLIDKKAIDLSNTKITVLDEADEMLNMGFIDDIKKVLSLRPSESQTLLFSATMPREISDLSKKFLKSPVVIDTVPKTVSKASISQSFFNVRNDSKVTIINRILTVEQPKLVIVFTNTKIASSDLAHELKSRGHKAEAIHGDLDQKERERAMDRFRKGTVKILCATDVAARGIDVNDVDMVINFDLPNEKEFYIHRIGRTGRAGRTGTAYSFVCNGRDRSTLKFIERYAGSPINEIPAPTAEQFYDKQLDNLVESLTYEENTDVEKLLETLNAKGFDDNKVAKSLLAKLLPVKEQEIGIGTQAKGRVTSRTSSDEYEQIRLNIGRNSRVTPPAIVNFIKDHADIFPRNIGDIDIFKDETLVQVSAKRARIAVRMLNGKKFNNIIIRPSIAQ